MRTWPFASQNAIEYPVEAVFTRAAGAAGRSDHGHRADAAEYDEIAGINRHADMIDSAARTADGGRNDIVPNR